MRIILILLFAIHLSWAENGGRAEYVGGTLTNFNNGSAGRVVTTGEESLSFKGKGKSIEVSYDKINLVEYGQKVDRRYIAAVLISPLFLMSKKRNHFLTIGFEDEKGKQQAMVFRVRKEDVRSLLVSLEARTGRKIQYQDEDARKAGKG